MYITISHDRVNDIFDVEAHCTFHRWWSIKIAVLILSYNKREKKFEKRKYLFVKMFYIVYLVKPRKNVIIPASWLDANYEQVDKFMFHGVNTNQRFRCFFNDELRDGDGVPTASYHPEFDKFKTDESIFPADGCYVAKLVKFNCE